MEPSKEKYVISDSTHPWYSEIGVLIGEKHTIIGPRTVMLLDNGIECMVRKNQVQPVLTKK